jgi:hypothetical protein
MQMVTRLPGDRTKNPPSPESLINDMRNDKNTYALFADYMVRTVHGKCRYAQKAGSKEILFSDFIPVSQEAFALLLYKNGYKNWIWMHDMNASSSDDTDNSHDEEKPGYQYTSTKAEKGTLFTRRNGGWSEEGMREFNALYAKVKANRAANNGDFDSHYKMHWVETHKPPTTKRKRTVRAAIVSICDDLVDPDPGVVAI